MRIAIGADHAGFPLKEHLIADAAAARPRRRRSRHPQRGAGGLSADLRRRRRAQVVAGRADRGIVLGGSGQGEQIAANKVRGVRAALCNDLYTARLSREHNDANVLAMGGRIVAFGLADEILSLWLEHRLRGRAPPAAASIRSPAIETGAGLPASATAGRNAR